MFSTVPRKVELNASFVLVAGSRVDTVIAQFKKATIPGYIRRHIHASFSFKIFLHHFHPL